MQGWLVYVAIYKAIYKAVYKMVVSQAMIHCKCVPMLSDTHPSIHPLTHSSIA